MALTTYIILEGVTAVEAMTNGAEPEPLQAGPGEELPEIELEVLKPFEAFRKIDALNAHSTDQALRKAAEAHGSGTFIAVSERHWKAETFEVETVSRVKIKSA